MNNETQLPSCLEVEQEIISSCLCDSTCFTKYRAQLKPQYFYSTNHARIIAAMLEIDNPDKGLIKAACRGMEDEIDAIFLHVCDFQLDHQIKILLEKYVQREALKAASRTVQTLYEEHFRNGVNLEAQNENKIVWDSTESRALITQMLTTEPEPFSFIVPGLLPKGVCGFIYGEGGSYKSLAALWLCVQRAAGHVANSKWLDRFEIYGAGKSMFCSIEDQIADIHHRMRAVVDRFSVMRSDVPRTSIDNAIAENFHIFPRERWMQDGFEHIVDRDGKPTVKAESVARYASDNGIDLIILDTLSRLSLVDENDNNAGARLVSALERIRDASGASVITIAHSGKAGRTGKTDTHGQNGLRGASALMDNGRFGLWFRSMPTKGGQPRLEIINAKTFRAMRAEPFMVAVDYPAFTLLEDEETSEDDLMDAIVADVRANPGTTQRLTRKRLKKDQKKITQGFKDAVEAGEIEDRGKGKGWFIKVRQ